MKVLIVDDDPVSRDILKAILGVDWHCDEAENGMIAVDMFMLSLNEGRPYDFICLDIMMPIMDGLSALKEIRRIEADKGIGGRDLVKVLMITALEDPQNVMEAFVKGSCEAYLVKPIMPAKLEGVLKEFGFAN